MLIGAILFSPQVGKNIGPPKTIDGLFGVPDQNQTALVLSRNLMLMTAAHGGFLGLVLSVNRLKNCVLHRIGILKFINQGHRIAIGNKLDQSRAARPPQGLFQPIKQIIK